VTERPCRADDEFIALHPLTQIEVRELHAAAVKHVEEMLKDPGTFRADHPWHTTMPTFTCSACSINDVCLLAFDAYNTDGDCLLDK
jgi:hypothetical protein